MKKKCAWLLSQHKYQVLTLSVLQGLLDLSVVYCLVVAIMALIKHHPFGCFVWLIVGYGQLEIATRHYTALQWVKLEGEQDAEEGE